MIFLHCILSFILFNVTYALYGLPCSTDAECKSVNEVCIAGRCGCKPNSRSVWQYGLSHQCDERKVNTCTSDEDCWNELEIRGHFKSHKSCNKNGICDCDPGYIFYYNTCEKVDRPSAKSFLKYCDHVDGKEIPWCHPEDNVFCTKWKRCLCYPSFYGDNKTKMCRPRSEYLQANGLTEYKVKPGIYCLFESDCIAGLKCSNHFCTCPEGCVYNARIESCDCGYFYDSNEYYDWGYTWPSIVGVFLGIMINICGCGCFIIDDDSDEENAIEGGNCGEDQTLNPMPSEENEPVTVPVVDASGDQDTVTQQSQPYNLHPYGPQPYDLQPSAPKIDPGSYDEPPPPSYSEILTQDAGQGQLSKEEEAANSVNLK